ncbi:MAG: hypothetical protein U0U46_19145 [Saprospiraceae bacterium]|nr:hypothetical protein [Saprospiraceae bacterium]HNL38485.1 hypothetical protein [Saprospiraceae bacterium]
MKHLLFAGICLVLISCRDRREALHSDLSNHVRFAGMAIGQASRFVLFEGESYYDPENFNFIYRPDTLILTVVGLDANGFLIEEKLTPGSASLHGAQYTPDAAETFRYYFSVEQDTLHQKAVPGQGAWPQTRLAIAPLTLPLAPFQSPEADIIGWKTDLMNYDFYWSAIDPDYVLFGIYYPDVNLLSDNRLMSPDGPGNWCAYSAASGLIKSATYSSWTGSGRGWDLLPD